MKLYVTYRSPYARLARIIVIEKALEHCVEIIEAKTRTPGSSYYEINPSGRVPFLVDDNGIGMEDSQLICAYLDGLDGEPRFHNTSDVLDWAYLRLEFAARSMCDGIAVWGREMSRPANERSQTTLAHRVSTRSAHGRFLRRPRGRSAHAMRHDAPHPGCRRGDGAQARARRPYGWPPRAGSLDALHLRSSFDAKDGPAVRRPASHARGRLGCGSAGDA